MTGVLTGTSEWIKTQIQPVVSMDDVDVFGDFILGFQLELNDKFKREISKISDSPVVLHLVQQVLNFDLTLKNSFGAQTSLLGILFSDDVFLEIWTRYQLKGNLEKLKEWISQEEAWERDLNTDSVTCCTMMIGLIESMTGNLF